MIICYYEFRFHFCACLTQTQCSFWHHRSLHTHWPMGKSVWCLWPESHMVKVLFIWENTVSFLQQHYISVVWCEYRVPQGSVLRPLLFSLNISLLRQIIHGISHGIKFHCYAGDTQPYVPVKEDVPFLMIKLQACLSAVKSCVLVSYS